MNGKHYFIIATLLGFLPATAQAGTFNGLWLTDDREGVVSITACHDAKSRVCGYLVRFPKTGHKELDRKLCGAKLIGNMKALGNRLTGGWIFDPENDQTYNLTIRAKKSPRAIHLRAYGRTEAKGESFTWTRYSKSADRKPKNYWAPCAT